jgi:hypothetical protein
MMQQAMTAPDKTGKWWFQGNSVKAGRVTTITPVQNKPFVVIEEGSALVPTDIYTGEPYAESELVGQWVEEPG